MNKYWFRKRRGFFTRDLGYGWVPITVEGWVSVAVFISSIVVFAFYFEIWNKNIRPLDFTLYLFSLIALFCLFCHKKCDYSIK